jgi:hypothetical protein
MESEPPPPSDNLYGFPNLSSAFRTERLQGDYLNDYQLGELPAGIAACASENAGLCPGTGRAFPMADHACPLMKSGVAKRVLFMVDSPNAGRPGGPGSRLLTAGQIRGLTESKT